MRKNHKLAWIITVCCFVILVILVRLLVLQFDSPAEGVIIKADPSKSTATNLDLSSKYISGSFASFNFPNLLTQQKMTSFTSPTDEKYIFTYRDIEPWTLAIEVMTVNSGLLNDNSGYKFREINPQTYQKSQVMVNNQPVIIMTDSGIGGFNKVAFLVHNQYQATVALSGDDSNGTQGLQKSFNMVLDSWHWDVN